MACTNNNNRKTGEYSKEVLDTIQSAPLKIIAEPLLFESAFVKGTQQKINDLTFNLYGITIGKVKIVSGRVVACDPILTEEYGKPFTQLFPTGEFPVQLSIAKLDDEEAVAFARIQFSEEPVVRWQLALLEGQQPIPMGEKKIHGYIVDSGTGSFMDNETVKTLNKDPNPLFESELYKSLDQHRHYRWNYTITNVGSNNFVAFSSGFGDGRYGTYIGFDVNGKPCRLLTNFDLFSGNKN